MRFGLALLLVACSRSPQATPRPVASVASAAPSARAASAAASTPVPSAAPEVSAVRPNRCITPESIGATRLLELKATNPREQQALVAARAELRRVLEDPAQFFANVQATDDVVLIELWHESAFAAENCGVVGNPGGKCRTFGFDPKKGRIISTKFWQ